MSVGQIASASDFAKALKDAGSKTVVIDFTASWCGPCRKMSPIFHDLAKEFGEIASFYQCDVDQAKDVAQSEDVSAMPTFRFYVGGKFKDQLRGADPSKLTAMVKQYTEQQSGGFFSAFKGKGHSLKATTSSSSNSAKAAGAQPERRFNPWADPNFKPPMLRQQQQQQSSAQPADSPARSAPKTPWADPSFKPKEPECKEPERKVDAPPVPVNEDEALAKAIAMSLESEQTEQTNDSSLTASINQTLLDELVDMGFPRLRAEKALIFTKSKTLDDATTWLVDHEQDADIDEPLTVVPAARTNVRGAPLGHVPGVQYDDGDGLSAAMTALQKKAAKQKEDIRKKAAAETGQETVDTSSMTKEEKLAYLDRLKAARKAQRLADEAKEARERDAARRETAKASVDAKRIREEQQLKLAASRAKREKAAEKERQKRIEEKLRADKEARIKARKEREEAKAAAAAQQ